MRRITEVAFEGKHSTLRIGRPIAGVVMLVITGSDVGEHGDGPFQELERDGEGGPFDLFVDARKTRGATIDVSSDWAQWLGAHRDVLRSIHMLTGSRFVQLTAQFVRNYATLGDIMRIYTDPAAFDEAFAARCAAE